MLLIWTWESAESWAIKHVHTWKVVVKRNPTARAKKTDFALYDRHLTEEKKTTVENKRLSVCAWECTWMCILSVCVHGLTTTLFKNLRQKQRQDWAAVRQPHALSHGQTSSHQTELYSKKMCTHILYGAAFQQGTTYKRTTYLYI